MQPTPDDDVWSAKIVRFALAAIAVIITAAGLALDGWLRWILLATAVLLACAAVTPRYRNPNG